MTETSQEIRQWAPPQALERLSVDQIKFIANTEVIPKALRGNPAAIIAVVLKGRALGLDDIHALSAIHFIEGKPTLAAETMMMLARRAGHSITVKADVDSATAKGKRADNGDTYEVTWTMEDATRAGANGQGQLEAPPAPDALLARHQRALPRPLPRRARRYRLHAGRAGALAGGGGG